MPDPTYHHLGDHTESIHVGLSHRDKTHHSNDTAVRVQVTGNTLRPLVTSDIMGERHGIFVGNSDSTTIKDNYVALTRQGNVRRFDLAKPPAYVTEKRSGEGFTALAAHLAR